MWLGLFITQPVSIEKITINQSNCSRAFDAGECVNETVRCEYVAHGMLCVMLFKEAIENIKENKNHTNHLIRGRSISIDITSIYPNAKSITQHINIIRRKWVNTKLSVNSSCSQRHNQSQPISSSTINR